MLDEEEIKEVKTADKESSLKRKERLDGQKRTNNKTVKPGDSIIV